MSAEQMRIVIYLAPSEEAHLVLASAEAEWLERINEEWEREDVDALERHEVSFNDVVTVGIGSGRRLYAHVNDVQYGGF